MLIGWGDSILHQGISLDKAIKTSVCLVLVTVTITEVTTTWHRALKHLIRILIPCSKTLGTTEKQ